MNILNPKNMFDHAQQVAGAGSLQNALGQAASSLNPTKVFEQAENALNPIAGLENAMQQAANSINPANIMKDVVKQAMSNFLTQLLPPTFKTIIQHPFLISSYTPLISKLFEWIGDNPYRIVLVATIGKLVLVVMVAVLAFMLFFFTATATAASVIFAGILFVVASTVSVTLSVLALSFCVWIIAKFTAPLAKMLMSKCKNIASALQTDGRIQLATIKKGEAPSNSSS